VDDVDEVAESEVIGVLSLAGDVQTRGGDQLHIAKKSSHFDRCKKLAFLFIENCYKSFIFISLLLNEGKYQTK
jgi:hypothetical protein